MTENQPEENESDRGIDRLLPSADRRSMLRGAAALGLGSGVIGSATAQEGGGGGKSDDGGESDDGGSKGVPVSIQLYTLRNLPDTVPQLIQRVGAVDNNGGPGYDAVEPAGLGDASPSEIADVLDQTGLTAPSAHIGLEELENNFEDTVETYTQIGCDTFIVPSADESAFSSVESVQAFAQRFNDLASRLSEEGIRLGYHNHDFEFEELGDQTAFEVFAEALNDEVVFEIDVGWALVAGHDPAAMIRRYSDRVELIHMKDQTSEGEFAELGEGDVDLVEVSEVARNVADVDLLVYEHDEPESPAASVATGAGVMSFLDGRPGLECLEFSDVGGPDYDGTLDFGGKGCK